MTSSWSPSSSGFDRCAARYEELRPVDDNWWEVFETIVRLGELRGQRVLEVGCGTGRLAEALQDCELARVWAVDASQEMVALAKGLGVNARVARAEALPFKPGWFDAAVLRMVAHLVDRQLAFDEAARILTPAGRIVVASEDPVGFDDVWFARWFPSVPALERTRFPSAELLRTELAAAGFADVRVERLEQQRSITRDQALAILREKAYSTFELLPRHEYEEGLARAEAGQPERLDYGFRWLVVAARKTN